MMALLNPKERERARHLAGESIVRSTLAYIKPGAPHRFSPERGRVENLVSLGILVAGKLDWFLERVQGLRDAKIGLPELGVGEAVLRLTRDHYAWTETGDRLSPAILLYTTLTIAAASLRDEPLSEAQRMMLSLTPRDSANLLEAIRIVDGRAYGRVSSEGLSPRRVEDRGITLGELAGLLEQAGLREYGFLKEARVLRECAQRVSRAVDEGKGLNEGIVDGFLHLGSLEPSGPLKGSMARALAEGGMSTPGGRKLLFDLDKKARGQGADASHLLPPLSSCVLASLLKGAKPP